MIQRYSVSLDTKPYSWTTDDENGEWVKWKDKKHLIPKSKQEQPYYIANGKKTYYPDPNI